MSIRRAPAPMRAVEFPDATEMPDIGVTSITRPLVNE
jgi:hypothetical protein